jgi:5'-3' exonuclease
VNFFRIIGEAAKVPLLEDQLRQAHETLRETIEEYSDKIKDIQAEHRAEIKELREYHEKELQYARNEIARLQIEVDRLRLVATSDKATAVLSAPSGEGGMDKLKATMEQVTGTPWQKLQQQNAEYIRKRALEEKNQVRQAAALSGPAPKENSNGSSG